MARREATFGDDLAASWAVWQEAPALPLLTLALAAIIEVASHLEGLAVVVWLAFDLVLAGWVGTQRIWYLRVFRGMRLERDELRPFTTEFIGRFVALGLLAGIPIVILVLPTFAVVHNRVSRALIASVVIFGEDVVLTFVTPALAFSTRSASEALSIGWRTLREGWPQTAPYALVPPLVLIGLAQIFSRGLLVVAVVIGLAGHMLGLWFKGATAAYYLRHHRVPDSGAT